MLRIVKFGLKFVAAVSGSLPMGAAEGPSHQTMVATCMTSLPFVKYAILKCYYTLFLT